MRQYFVDFCAFGIVAIVIFIIKIGLNKMDMNAEKKAADEAKEDE